MNTPTTGYGDRSPAIDRTRIPLFHLTWPILVENVLRVSLSSVDVLMLSFYSAKAVAAMGIILQFVFFLQLLYLMVSTGASILISQNLGAKRSHEAGLIALGSIVLAIMFSGVLSIAMFLCANPAIGLYKLDPEVHRYAWQFMAVYSLGSVFTALGMVQSAILRAHGHTREPMVVNIIANCINVFGNYLFIFGPLGIPVLGVTGVALATVASQAVACAIMAVRTRKYRDIELPLRRIFKVPGAVYAQILKVGVPTAGENLSYTIGQLLIMKIIAGFGTSALTATSYALTILRYIFITSVSIGMGTQIKVGYLVGAGMFETAYRKVYRYFLTGFALSVTLVSILFIAQSPILHLFTADADVLRLIAAVFVVSLVLEPGRNFNVIIIPALKGSGDVRFPVYMGMIFMWGVGVVFSYVFGHTFGWGLTGVWIALTCDEWIRGVLMLFRWRSGKWRTKALVTIPPIATELP
jgi:putative MATE family efflux protein